MADADITPHIDTAFPGSNIRLERIEQDTVVLRQDQRDTTEWWFYWAFRVRHAAGRTLRFAFTDGDVFSAMGPCISQDGHLWHWLGRDALDGNTFHYTFPPEATCTYFAVCPIYTDAHLQAFLTEYPRIAVSTLTCSEQGRPVIHLTLPSEHGTAKVLLTARHHACEAIASYALEGAMRYWFADEEEAAWLRQHVDLHLIPFVDTDGVEAGDQGKSRYPHDHNRDYLPQPHYASTRALMTQAPGWRGHFLAALDLHCPLLRDGRNETIFMVEPEAPWSVAVRQFAGLLRDTHTGELPYDPRNNLPFGVEWNQPMPICSDFFRRAGAELAFTMEIPYAKVEGVTVTPDNARRFGSDLMRALAHYARHTMPA